MKEFLNTVTVWSVIGLFITTVVVPLIIHIRSKNSIEKGIIERLWLELDDIYSLREEDLTEDEKKSYEKITSFLSRKGYWNPPDYYHQTKHDRLRIKALEDLIK